MDYYFSRTINASYNEAISLVTDALAKEGFGIVSQINMHEKLKQKLDVEFKKYTILGACNPSFAYKALQIEDKIGIMLPCNVLVIEQGSGKIEIAVVNPIASMQAISNTALNEVAIQVTAKLKNAVMTVEELKNAELAQKR